MFFIMHHAKKWKVEVELKLHAFFTSVVDGCEWSASRFGSFNQTA